MPPLLQLLRAGSRRRKRARLRLPPTPELRGWVEWRAGAAAGAQKGAAAMPMERALLGAWALLEGQAMQAQLLLLEVLEQLAQGAWVPQALPELLEVRV